MKTESKQEICKIAKMPGNDFDFMLCIFHTHERTKLISIVEYKTTLLPEATTLKEVEIRDSLKAH